MNDPWEKAYVYGRLLWSDTKMAHIVVFHHYQPFSALCGVDIRRVSRIPKPYPVCKNCLRTKRAKELGL